LIQERSCVLFRDPACHSSDRFIAASEQGGSFAILCPQIHPHVNAIRRDPGAIWIGALHRAWSTYRRRFTAIHGSVAPAPVNKSVAKTISGTNSASARSGQ
jgi:hypothetical protein